MALDALSCNELLNFIIHDTISVTPYSSLESSGTTTAPAAAAAAAAFIFETEHSLNLVGSGDGDGGVGGACTPSIMNMHCLGGSKPNARKATLGVLGRKRWRRRPKVCKNKEEEETQRMTHIAIERNRRKQMNEHLAALRSLMPESYVQRGDQASVVGGAIMFVKEMEHLLQSLEAKKLEQKLMEEETQSQMPPAAAAAEDTGFMRQPFSHFFVCPQYTWLQLPSNSGSKYSSTSSSSASLSSSRSSRVNGNDNGNGGGGVMAAIADIEVTLIETHANLRILSRRSPMQLSRLVAGFHTLQLSILHLNVITLHPLVLYSISAKVEEGCQLTTVDDISGAVHHMLRIIEEGESALC